MISKGHVIALCSVAQGGFAYESAKAVASAADWELVDDERELGFLRFSIEILSGEERRALVVVFNPKEKAPFAFIPLFCFPAEANQFADFNSAFQSVAKDLDHILGKASCSGDYQYPHREWRYSHCWWSLPEAEVVLVQDEFDIQNGLDVTLWIRSAGTPVKMPVRP